jgi:hypothetical protein
MDILSALAADEKCGPKHFGAASHPLAKDVSSPMTYFTVCPGTSFTLPRERSERGNVKDVPGQTVKDVMRPNTQNAEKWGTPRLFVSEICGRVCGYASADARVYLATSR